MECVSNRDYISILSGEIDETSIGTGSGDETNSLIRKVSTDTQVASSINQDDELFLLEEIIDKIKDVQEDEEDDTLAFYGKTTTVSSRYNGKDEEAALLCENEMQSGVLSASGKVDASHAKGISVRSPEGTTISDASRKIFRSPTQSFRHFDQTQNAFTSHNNSIKINNQDFTELQLSSQVLDNSRSRLEHLEGNSSDDRKISKQFHVLKERYLLATTIIDQLRSQNQRLTEVNQRNRLLLENTLLHQQNIRNKMVSHISEAKQKVSDRDERVNDIADRKIGDQRAKKEIQPEVLQNAISLQIAKDQVIDLKINNKANEGVEQFTKGLTEVLDLVHTQHLNVMQQEHQRYVEATKLSNGHSEPVALVDTKAKEMSAAEPSRFNDPLGGTDKHDKGHVGNSRYDTKAKGSASIECEQENICIDSLTNRSMTNVPAPPETDSKVKGKSKRRGLWKSCFPTFNRKQQQKNEGKSEETSAISPRPKGNKDTHRCNDVEYIRVEHIEKGLNRQNSTADCMKDSCGVVHRETLRAIEIIYDNRQMAKVQVFSLQIDTDRENHFSQLLCQVQQVVFERNSYKEDLRRQLHYNRELIAASETSKKQILRLRKQYQYYKSKSCKFQKAVYQMEAQLSRKENSILAHERGYERCLEEDYNLSSRRERENGSFKEQGINQRYFKLRRPKEERSCTRCKDKTADRELITVSFIEDYKEVQIKYKQSQHQIKKLELDLDDATRELDVTKRLLESEQLRKQSLRRNYKQNYGLLSIDFEKISTENMELKQSKAYLESKVETLIKKVEKTKERNRSLRESLMAYRQRSKTDGKVKVEDSEHVPPCEKKKYDSLLLERDCGNKANGTDRRTVEKLEEKCKKLSEERETHQKLIKQLTERVQYLLDAKDGKGAENEHKTNIKSDSKLAFERKSNDGKAIVDAHSSLDSPMMPIFSGAKEVAGSNEGIASQDISPPQSVVTKYNSDGCLYSGHKNEGNFHGDNIKTMQDETDQTSQEKVTVTDCVANNNELTNDVDSLKEGLKEAGNPNTNTSFYISENERLQNDLLQWKEKFHQASLKIESLQSESDDNKRIKEELHKTEEDLRKASEELKCLQDMKEENKMLKEQRDALEKKSQLSSDQLNLIKELQDNNQKLRAERDTLKENASERASQSEKMNAKLENLQIENEDLQQKIEELRENDKLSELQKDVEHLETICRELRSENQELIGELEDNGIDKIELEKKITNLEKSLEEMKEETESFEDKEEEMFKLNKQIEKLQNDLLEKAEEIQCLEGDLENEQAKVEKLTKTLKDEELKNKKKGEVSMIDAKNREVEKASQNKCYDREYLGNGTLSQKKGNTVEEADMNHEVRKDNSPETEEKLIDDDSDFDSDFLNQSYVPTWLQPTDKTQKKSPENDQGSASRKEPTSRLNAKANTRPQSQPTKQSEFEAKGREEIRSATQAKAKPAWSLNEQAKSVDPKGRGNSHAAQSSSQDSSDPFVTSLELTANTRRGKRASLSENSETVKADVRPKTSPEIINARSYKVTAEAKVLTRSTIDEETELEKAAALSRERRGSSASFEMTSEVSKEDVNQKKVAASYSINELEDELDKFARFEARRKQYKSSQAQPKRRSCQGDELKILSMFGDNNIQKRS